MIAHVREDEDGKFAIQEVDEHCRKVAELAEGFMYAPEDSLGQKDLAYAAGLLHDFGKYRGDFQHYISIASGLEPDKSLPPKAPHAIVGAAEALRCYRPSGEADKVGRSLAYAISAHHRGLYDYLTLRDRLQRSDRTCDECERNSGGGGGVPNIPESTVDPIDDQMMIRMLFSSLVDADYLDTESFMAPDISEQRRQIVKDHDSLETLRRRLREKTDSFRDGPDTPVNRSRAYFLEQCRAHGASSEPGIYTLSLPTGAGKTLSSMAWALEMAIRNHHERIIYVIPFTSIVTQTAEVFRSIFGEENVLEHHSEVVIDRSDKEESDRRLTRLHFLTENWDTPIILTTNVQFFESLFSSKPSKCRKNHNVANAVIVMDEAQALPDEFLNPIRSCIDSLSYECGSSILLCTATQPVYNCGIRGLEDLDIDGDVIPRDEEHFAPFSRVRYHLKPVVLTPTELAEQLVMEPSVLCVVNSRKDAALVYRELLKIPQVDKDEVIHLSRMMCSAHLRKVIHTIKERMKKGLPTKVISTQLIEAGVDLDFPSVWRAHAGLSSIIQAGGRCNREGNRQEKGEVKVFEIDGGGRAPQAVRNGQYATEQTLRHMDDIGLSDPTDPEAVETYFSQYFGRCPCFDKEEIMSHLESAILRFDFETVSERFKLIDDRDSYSVIIPYETEGEALVEKIRFHQPLTKYDYHKMQDYSVSLRERDCQALLAQGSIEVVSKGDDVEAQLLVLTDKRCYDQAAGVVHDNHWLEELQMVSDDHEENNPSQR